MRRRSLVVRLLAANLIIVVVAAAALFVTARLVGPRLFDTEVRQIGMRYGWSQGGGPGRQGGDGPVQQAALVEEELNAAFTDSLDLALLVAALVGVVTAAGAAVVVSRRLVRPIEEVGAAVRDIADGDYGRRVPTPGDRELAELADDVNALGDTLAATEERRARLVSDLAHELRTPITSLDGFVEGLEDGVFEPDAETLAAIRSETARLGRLADDLGALSRTDEHAFDLALRDADLGEVAAAAAGAMAAAYRTAGVDLDVAVAPDVPVRVDTDRMGQVFANLLRNALEHTPAGGSVTVSADRAGDRAVASVADTGTGSAPGDLERVFDRFVRLDSGGAAGGTGIGLTIARGIVDAHGGALRAASEGRGRGTAFEVSLPLRG